MRRPTREKRPAGEEWSPLTPLEWKDEHINEFEACACEAPRETLVVEMTARVVTNPDAFKTFRVKCPACGFARESSGVFGIRMWNERQKERRESAIVVK